MLIPLGTDRPRRRSPIITYLLLSANVAAFILLASLERSNPDRARAILAWGQLWGHPDAFRIHSLVTSAFLHGGWIHLLGNMLFLWVFGPNVEDKFGRIGFSAFYLLAGAASGGLHAFFSDHPAIGASGAIAGVTGAYLVLFPKTLVRCLVLFILIGVISIPAWWFVAFGIAWDFLSPAIVGDTGVAHLAHLGGYAFGIAVPLILLKLRILSREPYDLFTAIRQARRRAEMRNAHTLVQRRQRARGRHAEPAATGEADPVAEARARVTSAISAGDMDAAVRAYRDLLKAHGLEASLLSRQRQYDLANHLYQIGEFSMASLAYQRFLGGYPGEREGATIKLILAIIDARHLNDPIRAERFAREAIAEGLNHDDLQLARAILRELGVSA